MEASSLTNKPPMPTKEIAMMKKLQEIDTETGESYLQQMISAVEIAIPAEQEQPLSQLPIETLLPAKPLSQPPTFEALQLPMLVAC